MLTLAEQTQKIDPSPSQLMDWYRQMSLIRQLEMKCAQSYQQQKVGGFCHLYVGQEAVAVGSDWGDSRPSGLHHHRVPGPWPCDRKWACNSLALFAELYGKATGCSRGKGGSMHFFDKDKNFFGGHAIVAGHIPLAVGLG